MATTPEPSCFLPSSTRLLRSFISMPSTARAISLTLPTSRTPLAPAADPLEACAPPPIASFLRASDRSRSSFLRSSIREAMRAGMSSSVVRSSVAADRDQADIAGATHMGAAAQFHRPAERVAAVLPIGLAHRYHAHLVAVFFAEQRPGAGVAGIVHRHQPGGDLVIFQHHVVGDILDAAQFLRRDRLGMHEVEA